MTQWQDYAPEKTSRVRERIEWGITYTYNTNDTGSPRVLLIGDSICNGYQDSVRRKLEGRANVTFWASSKCVTDPDYFKELLHIATMQHYDVISFNNGLHSLSSDRTEWSAAFAGAVRMLTDACPDAVLFLTLSTPLKDPALTECAAALNGIVRGIAQERNLPVIDLFSPMDKLDREEYWRDTYHFHAPAIDMQSDVIVENVLGKLGRTGSAGHAATLTGPDGKME